jgi:hypothetical protein|tara:strand:+ start:249 stop:446 length:198 start_codon:yes stop_codon:yes gene_type:complete
MKTKFEEYAENINNLITEHTKKLHISELDQIVESIEDSPIGTGRMDFWLEDIVDDELVSRNLPSE